MRDTRPLPAFGSTGRALPMRRGLFSLTSRDAALTRHAPARLPELWALVPQAPLTDWASERVPVSTEAREVFAASARADCGCHRGVYDLGVAKRQKGSGKMANTEVS